MKLFDGAPAFTGRSGAFVAELVGVDREALGEVFELRNLFDRFPGRKTSAKGALFFRQEARLKANTFDLTGRNVVLAGRAVASAFTVGRAPYFAWTEFRNGRVAVIPHPSGLNR